MAGVCSYGGSEPSWRSRILLRPHLLTVIAVLVMLSPMSTHGQCPADDPKCYCERDRVICSDLRDVSQVPPFFPSKDTYDSLTISGSTTVSTVQEKAFVDLKVVSIRLLRLDITTLGPGAFTGLEEVLEKVNLGRNKISTIASYTFNGLLHLSELYLNYNSLFVLDHNAFSYLPKLLFVCLSDNRIRTIKDSAIGGFYNLRTLLLNGNYIKIY